MVVSRHWRAGLMCLGISACSAPPSTGRNAEGDAGPVRESADAGGGDVDGGATADAGLEDAGRPDAGTRRAAPFEGCPPGTLRIDNAWGLTAIETGLVGEFTDNIVSVRFVPTPPSNPNRISTRTSSWVNYRSSLTLREASLSTKACDFSDEHALKNGRGEQMVVRGNAGSVNFLYRAFTPLDRAAGLQPGVEYYVNIRNRDATGAVTCQVDCDMRGGVPDF